MKKKKQKKTDAAGKYTLPAAGPGWEPSLPDPEQPPQVQRLPYRPDPEQPPRVQRLPYRPDPARPPAGSAAANAALRTAVCGAGRKKQRRGQLG